MSIGKTIQNIGYWLEKHFPEKLTADEVYNKFAGYESTIKYLETRMLNAETRIVELMGHVDDLTLKAATFNSDINKTKVMLLSQRAGR